MTINNISFTESVDGRKLATVRFVPEAPNPAQQPAVDVVFEVHIPGEVYLDEAPFAVVGPLSSTVEDTRETYELSKDQKRAVVEALLATSPEDW